MSHVAFRGCFLAAVCVAALTSVLGCEVEFAADVAEEATRNTCGSDSDCRGGRCSRGMCQTNITEIPALLLEVTPSAGTQTPEDNPPIAGLRFTSVITAFDWDGSGYEINLGHVSSLRAAVSVAAPNADSCLVAEGAEQAAESPPATDGSIPARLTLTPRARLLGLPNPAFTGAVEVPSAVSGSPGETSYRVNLSIPPGRYDVYVEPESPSGGCSRPPLLLLDQEIQSGNVNLNIELPPPELLSVTVRYPRATDDLDGWTLDIVQRDSGRVLSSQAVLSDPEQAEEGLNYQAQLAFSGQIAGGEEVAGELVRLSPPDDVVAPTLYVERNLVDLFQDGEGVIDQLTELPDPVQYRGRVTVVGRRDCGDDGNCILLVPSTVTLVAIELDSANPGTVAAFSRTAEGNDDGYFEAELVPGVYRVLVEPKDPNYARKIVEVTVTDATSSQTGPTVEVVPRHVVQGRLVSFDGSTSVFGASLHAVAVPQDANVSVIERAQGAILVPPVALGDITESDGSFNLNADDGTFHLSARPAASSGFAWAVLLRQDVMGARDLGSVELPLPLVVRGRLTSQDLGGVVPNALIRAYALLQDGELATSEEDADSVVAVGESRVDESGDFTLLLPSAFK